MVKWKEKISVYMPKNATLEQAAKAWERGLKKSRWYKNNSALLQSSIDELLEATDFEEFDSVLSEIYDGADIDRVWIAVVRNG